MFSFYDDSSTVSEPDFDSPISFGSPDEDLDELLKEQFAKRFANIFVVDVECAFVPKKNCEIKPPMTLCGLTHVFNHYGEWWGRTYLYNIEQPHGPKVLSKIYNLNVNLVKSQMNYTRNVLQIPVMNSGIKVDRVVDFVDSYVKLCNGILCAKGAALESRFWPSVIDLELIGAPKSNSHWPDEETREHASWLVQLYTGQKMYKV